MTIPRDSFLQRIMKYCAEAERSTHDVLYKLVSWGISMDESEIILAKLRAEKFLDDRRFATSYVKEKWTLDQWGKLKIANALRQKNLNNEWIEMALGQIDEEEYIRVLHDVLDKKRLQSGTDNPQETARRIMMFALSRGFEEELINDWLEKHLPEAY